MSSFQTPQGYIQVHTNFQTSLEPRLMHNLLRR